MRLLVQIASSVFEVDPYQAAQILAFKKLKTKSSTDLNETDISHVDHK
jgi:hypothetical protein